MSLRTPFFRDEGRLQVSTYESFLDLFTLLSFVLIISAILRFERLAGSDSGSVVTAQKVAPSPNVAHVLSREEIVFILHKTNGVDCLYVMDGPTQFQTNLVVSAPGLETTLVGFLPDLLRSAKIELGVRNLDGGANPAILMGIEQWLNSKGFKQYSIFFF